LARGLASALPEDAARAFLGRRLRSRLYESFYCLGGVGTIEETGAQDGRWPDPELVAALSAANAGRGTWEEGWRLEARRDGGLLVSRDGLRVLARPSECRNSGTGAELAVALPPELPARSPGYFTILGDVNLDPAADELIARLYFHVTCAGAPDLVSGLTAGLNRARVPFRLKVLDHPDRFGRCDAAVLYLPAVELRRRRRLVGRVVEACAHHVEPRTPVFTRTLAPGVGLGEERGDAEESFGMRRCRILADGLVSAHEQRRRGLDARLATVARHFDAAGIDLDAPYLEPGSADDYAL
jgi:class II lanthipeptide synthase